ncbi:MAG: hypothetical protein ACYTFM_05600 [Planctomycetota bacterium]|jgi:hypothetical protein
MIKTLHITIVVIGILTVGLIVSGSIIGSRSDEDVKEILESVSAIEKFKTSQGKTTSRKDNRSSPLVTEAKTFALYLNPPPKPEPKRKPSSKKTAKSTTKKRPKGQVSAKFNLIGTSYHPSNPETSMALVDQPGKGLSWVRQGEKVGHLLFEQIQDGVVIIRDGKKTSEMSSPIRAEDQTIEKLTVSGTGVSKKTSSRRTSRRSSPAKKPEMSPEEKKMIDELFAEVEAALMNKDPVESNSRSLDDMFSSLSNIRMDTNEADRLSELGETLEKTRVPSIDEPGPEPNLAVYSEPNVEINYITEIESDSEPNEEFDFRSEIEPNLDPNYNDPNSTKIKRSVRRPRR